MNKKQKITIIAGVAVIIIALTIWLADGTFVFTQTKVLVEKTDPLFGTTYKEWKNQFIWGLDLTLIVAAISILISGILFFVFKPKRKVSNEISN